MQNKNSVFEVLVTYNKLCTWKALFKGIRKKHGDQRPGNDSKLHPCLNEFGVTPLRYTWDSRRRLVSIVDDNIGYTYSTVGELQC
jgi:hypothetical protein